MAYSSKLIVGLMLFSIVAGYATSAGATKGDQALAICRQRGSDCKALKVHDGNTVVIICVNNSSTGNGIQCVSCAEGQDCAVLRKVSGSNHGKLVNGILTNSGRKQ